MLIGSAPLTEDPNAFAMSVCAEDRCVFIGPKGTAMDSISDVFFSWQFLLVGLAVFLIFAFFNEVVGPRLWRVRWLRCVLKELEGIKVIWPPIFGFALGWIPAVPRPDELHYSSQFTVALLYAVAGLCSLWIVKFIKKQLESRGINIDWDVNPREQMKSPWSSK